MKIEPRVIRLTDAPAYLGMGIKYFNEHVRPHVELVSIGYHMKMFDRLYDLELKLSKSIVISCITFPSLLTLHLPSHKT